MFLLAHEVPGRFRFTAPALKRNHAAGAELCTQMRGLPGVTAASANVHTGSLIVYHDGMPATRHGILSHLGTAVLPARRVAGTALPARSLDLADTIAHALAEKLVHRMVHIAVATLI